MTTACDTDNITPNAGHDSAALAMAYRVAKVLGDHTKAPDEGTATAQAASTADDRPMVSITAILGLTVDPEADDNDTAGAVKATVFPPNGGTGSMAATVFVHPTAVPIDSRKPNGIAPVELLRSMVTGLEALPEDTCWRAPGETRDQDGYGQVRLGGRMVQGHRLILAWSMGLESDRDLPVDRVVDHLCRVRECVNPRHLRLVTSRENTLCGVGPTADQARRTHCPRGHLLQGSNLRTRADGYRECKRCKRAHDAAYSLMRHGRPYGTIVPREERHGIIAEVQVSVGELPNLTADQSASLARALTKAIIHARYDVPTDVA